MAKKQPVNLRRLNTQLTNELETVRELRRLDSESRAREQRELLKRIETLEEQLQHINHVEDVLQPLSRIAGAMADVVMHSYRSNR